MNIDITNIDDLDYFLLRNITIHEPIHDFAPSGNAQKMKKFNDRIGAYRSGGTSIKSGGDHQTYMSPTNNNVDASIDDDTDITISDFKYFNNETVESSDKKITFTNFNISKILSYDPDIANENDDILMSTINRYITGRIQDDGGVDVQYSDQEHGAAEEREQPLNVNPRRLIEELKIIKEYFGEKEGPETRNTKKQKKLITDTICNIIEDSQTIVSLSDYFRLLSVSQLFQQTRITRAQAAAAVGVGVAVAALAAEASGCVVSGGGKDDGMYSKIRTNHDDADIDDAVEEDAVAVEEDAVAVEEDAAVEDDAATVEQDATVQEDAATVEEDAATVQEDAATVQEDAATVEQDAATVQEDAATVEQDAAVEEDDLISPFLHEYIEFNEILAYFKDENGWFNLETGDYTEYSYDDLESVINDIKLFFDFYSKIFNYYIREINNRNSVLQIINSNFIRNGLFIYFLNKITNLEVKEIPDTDDFFYSIFKIGETKISDPQSNVLYKLTGLPYINTNDVMNGGNKTIMDGLTLFLKKFTKQHEDMERIHLKTLSDDLRGKLNRNNTREYLKGILDQEMKGVPNQDTVIDALKHQGKGPHSKWLIYNSIESDIYIDGTPIEPYNLYTSNLVNAICAMINLVDLPATSIETTRINDISYREYLEQCESLIRQIFGAILVRFINIVDKYITKIPTDVLRPEEIVEWQKITGVFRTQGAQIIVNTIISARRLFGTREIGDESKSSYKCNLIEKINCGIFQNLINKITTLNKDKKLKKIFKTKIDTGDNKISTDTTRFSNNLLISLAKNINSKFNNDNPKNLVYKYEKTLLNDIEKNTSITTQADDKLLDNFKKQYRDDNDVFINDDMSYSEYIGKLKDNGGEVNHIINNALTSKISKEDRSRDQIMKFISLEDELKVKCLISSILDAQDSFGSCKGKVPEEFHNSNIIIKNNDGIEFEFGLNIYSTTKDLYIVKYYLTAITEDDKPFGIYGEITEKLTKNRKLLLSAVNSFDRVLDLLEDNHSYALAELANKSADTINFDTILSSDDNSKIMSSISNKAIGDISQELATIIINTGYVNMTTKFPRRLLADGDRPSFVRAGILLKEAGFNMHVDVPNIDRESGIFYSSEKGKKTGTNKTSLYIVKQNVNNNAGGAIKNRKRGHKIKKNKIKKNKTKKNKKNKKNKPKKSKKNINKLNKNKKTTIKKRKKQNKVKRKSIKK